MGRSSHLLHHPASAALLLFFLLLRCSSAATYSQQFTSNFTSFADSDRSNLAILGDATISHDALQITPDTQNISYLANKTGRVLLQRPFKLWDDRPTSNSTARYLASFNTSFTINIVQQNGIVPGEGIAFLITSNIDPPPPGSDGGYLGLTNSTINGMPTNHFVAVEFDTLKQSFDPDDNHVGLDINSVVSNTTVSLTPFGIKIAASNNTDYTFYKIWIDYDGPSRYISVYMTVQGRPKPTTAVLNASLDLSDHLLQSSYFGFAGSTGTNYQLNCVLAWNLTVEDLSSSGDKDGATWKLATAIVVPAVVVIVIVGILVGSYMRRRKIGDGPRLLAGTLRTLPGTPQEFQFKELKKATNNFDEKLKLGQGGFGIVYKGVLSEENIEVAVKKFSREQVKSQDDFLSELTIINRLRHKHLVRLLGWCHKNGVLLLVYDYMPNGSLDQHLYGDPERPLLNWERRYNIIVGVASALHYLHNEYDQKVVHRDLKASNVLLDASFNARLGDFGLARALETDKTSYVEVELGGFAGTLGYIAPECFLTGKATRESDVFGFGATVLEVTCGRRPRSDIGGFIYLVDWVWKLHREGNIREAVDPRLAGDYVEPEAERLLLLGLACCHPISMERPKAQAIVQILSGLVPPPQVLPFKPSFVWPAVLVKSDDEVPTVSSTLTNTIPTSTDYQSSTGWTPRYLSQEGHMGGGGISSTGWTPRYLSHEGHMGGGGISTGCGQNTI